MHAGAVTLGSLCSIRLREQIVHLAALELGPSYKETPLGHCSCPTLTGPVAAPAEGSMRHRET